MGLAAQQLFFVGQSGDAAKVRTPVGVADRTFFANQLVRRVKRAPQVETGPVKGETGAEGKPGLTTIHNGGIAGVGSRRPFLPPVGGRRLDSAPVAGDWSRDQIWKSVISRSVAWHLVALEVLDNTLDSFEELRNVLMVK
nr:hypothetical protein Iba_chr10fCG4790 [Ipomoea batatas]